MRARMSIVAALLLLAAGLYGGWQRYAHVSTSNQFKENFHSLVALQVGMSEAGEALRSHIHRVGGERAYEDFSEAVWSLGGNEQHGFAHLFGEMLFEEEGLAATAVCDSRFTMGCWHAFFGEAIIALGSKAVHEAAAFCDTQPSSHDQSHCAHGLGHGILATEGYDINDLLKGLAECNSLSSSISRGGCINGIFMEYNERTTLGVEATPREPDSSNPYSPCVLLEEEDQMRCFFWQPKWWSEIFFASIPDRNESFKRMGMLCAAIQEQEQQEKCFQGIGYAAAWAPAFEPSGARSFCQYASPHTTLQLVCKSQAALTVAMNSGSEVASHVCAGLEGNIAQICLAWANRKTSVLNGATVSQMLLTTSP